MINFNKNKLINEVLKNYYNTFQQTLDTADFVPDKYNAKIDRYIFKNMKKSFKQIEKEDRIYQRELKKKEKLKKKRLKQQKQLNKPKIKFLPFLKSLFSKLKFKRSKKKIKRSTRKQSS